MHIVKTKIWVGSVKTLTVFGSAFIRLLCSVIEKIFGMSSLCTSKETIESDPDTLESYRRLNLLHCLCSAALGRVNAGGG